ncbi:hypothetical protein FACS189443_4320 [Planctomycetales bacterium]|nr:hypothetical protein FACS189443_4320 [Planctomycetales bacterium]
MNRQLLEIDSKIERHARAILVLENKKRKLYQSSSSAQNEEVPLNFDDVGRTIRWNRGSIRLSKKPYLFVKTLWNAPRHRAEIDTLEKRFGKEQ